MLRPLGAFLRGRAAARANPRPPLAPVLQRLLALPLAERRDFFVAKLWVIDWWMRGRMMQAEGYVDEAHAPREEQVVAEGLRAVCAVLCDPPADPAAPTRLFRAVVASPEALPVADWRELPGHTWRTALRPLQSWTDSLASARAFALSESGRRFLAPGRLHFIVEAEVPEGRVLFRHAHLVDGLRRVAEGARALDTRTYAVRHAQSAAYYAHLVSGKHSQYEVVLDLPRGETRVAAVHPIDP